MTGEAEFDDYCQAYQDQHAASIRITGEDTGYFAQYKARDARQLARRAGCGVAAILDFGSGIGNSVGPLRENFPDAQLTCADVSAGSLAISRKINGEGPAYVAYDGQALPFADNAFDLTFTACVFHHIPREQHVAILSELRRVLRPDGLFVLYEHNPWNPLTRHAVASCPFDKDAVLIAAGRMKQRLQAAGFADVRTDYRVFFPRMLSALRPLEPLLSGVPLGGQYVLSARGGA